MDYSKIIFDSRIPAFSNNKIYTGNFAVSGTLTEGTNTRTQNITLDQAPDMTQIMFNGPNDGAGTDPRPSDGWFEEGTIWALGSDGVTYFNFPMPFSITTDIVGTTLIITLTAVQQFTATLTLTPITVYYRVVDYSVFAT